MSRVSLESKEEGGEVVVGWDQPLNAFFAQAYGPEPEDPKEDNPPKLWELKCTGKRAAEVAREYAVDNARTREVIGCLERGQDPSR